MTKSVAEGSFEHAIREALRSLGEDGAVDALECHAGQRKSPSLLRKCADPDDQRHHIQLRDALALDRACLAANHGTPLLRAYELKLQQDQVTPPKAAEEDLLRLSLEINVAAGELSAQCIQALQTQPVGSGGCPRPHAIEAALAGLERKTRRMRRALGLPHRLCEPGSNTRAS